jgi:hypothetical protein
LGFSRVGRKDRFNDGLDAPFIFNQLENSEFRPLGGLNPDQDLSGKMMAAWTSFARKSNQSDKLPL